MSQQVQKPIRQRAATSALAILLVLSVAVIPSAQAQTFTVIHAFTGGGDGYYPYGGLTLDGAGNLYGTTTDYTGPGTVFKLKRSSGGWVLNTLYTFHFYDGAIPQGRAVLGPNGTLYGTTTEFGSGGSGCGDEGCGVVYNLRPPRTACHSVVCPWTETVLYNFNGYADGGGPNYVDPVFDQGGNLYGTTFLGGSNGVGVVFKLTHSGGGWTESVIHNFTITDGAAPASGMIFDGAGNLYGTTYTGGIYGYGNVFRLAPIGSGWTASTLYSFQGGPDGSGPIGGLMFDQLGNLYGTTFTGGSSGGGTVFELVPSGGNWTYSLLYGLNGGSGSGPQGNLAMDAAGNLYGATYAGGIHGYGSVFKLTPMIGSWTYTSLHDFTGGNDGANPVAGVTLDANGNVYGTAVQGGMQGFNCGGCGVVYEITP
jgi:uncharacterized repeat protein (TIGR03803 family)